MIRSTKYTYPTHLREAINELPATPGVYTFHGAKGDLPLYIGKSINIRNRVLSHLRTHDEARMLRQTRRITYIRCAGEIGALLLEASMIKQQQPLFNQKLRRTKQMCALTIQDRQPTVVYSKDINFATQTGLYGLFASRQSALEKIRDIADEHRLCLSLLGLEKIKPGQPCFRSMISRCAGACCGKESGEAHHNRLIAALTSIKIICWPYPGAIGIIERHPDMTQIHAVQNWCYLGSAADLELARALTTQASGFDADGYKILCRPLLADDTEIVEL